MVERKRVLGFLHELEHADEEVGALLAELDELAREVESVRSRAVELEALLTRLPAERQAAEAARAKAAEELTDARAALAAAKSALDQAEGDRQRNAEHFVTRARDRLSVAERHSGEAAAAVAALAVSEREAEAERGALAARAQELARRLRERPRLAGDAGADPRSGLDGIAEWGSGARAALLVARGQLAAERDAVIRQAYELGAVVLGQPLTAAGARVVVRRVEEELSD